MKRLRSARPGRRRIVDNLASGVALAVALSGAAPGWSAEHQFSIEAMPLRTALERYAQVTGRQLLYSSALVSGISVHRLSGSLSDDAALVDLLRGTGLSARRVGENTWIIERGARELSATAPTKKQKPVRAREGRVAATAASATAEATAPEVVVTGSNIRGANGGASPTTRITRDDIDRSGKGTIAEVIADLPQNFSGTGTEDTSLVSSDRTVLNTGLGSSADLRGLGADATLTLVNGRRVAGSGGRGDFTDLSTIPTGAVERIEVVTDGASAIYGADAVGGVINIILKRDFEGAESRFRIGSVTSGTLRDYQFGQLLGHRWPGGNALLSYEFQHRDNLPASERRYTSTADLRPYGGDDFRSVYADPGTIMVFNPATGALAPKYAIPTGQDGTHLTSGQLTAGANRQDILPGKDLLPAQTRHSLYATVEQELSASLSLYAEGRYTQRRFHYSSLQPDTLITVGPNNPYYVPVDTSGTSYIAYSLADELGPVRAKGEVAALSGTVGATWKIFGDWQAEGYYSYAEETTHDRYDNLVNNTFLSEALGNSADNASTVFSAARDGYFNPYGDHANKPAVLAFIAQGFQAQRDHSQLSTGSIKADGTLFRLPAGPVKLAVGGQIRRENFEVDSQSFYSGITPPAPTPAISARTIAAAFGELNLPLFGEANALPGLRRLALTAAARYEHSGDFGSTTNPKVGLIWEPIGGLRLHASYGTSFRAPGLTDLHQPEVIVYTLLPNTGGGYSPVVYLSGGNPNLKPERAKSWTLGFTATPAGNDGPRIEATWFRTTFNNRIGLPVLQQILKALTDPTFTPFVTKVDPANNPADAARVTALINDPTSYIPRTLPASYFAAIVDGRVVNSSEVDVSGIDASISQRFTAGPNQFAVTIGGSYMIHYKTRLTPTAPAIDQVNTLGFPNDLRARASVDWSRGPVGATLTGNYLDSFVDNVSMPSRPVGSWTTFDLQLRYAPKDAHGWRHGLILSLSAQNLFDTDPPFVNQGGGLGYDASSADPLGRFVSFQITKRW